MKLVLTGSLAMDQIMNFDGLYEEIIQKDKLHVLSLSVLLKSLQKTRGGIAGNIAYSLGLLGEHPILFSSIGQDGKEYMQALKKVGVDISHVHFSKLPTASFSVITDRNHCQVGGFYPGAMGDAKKLTVKKFSQEDVLVVISPHDPDQMNVQLQECEELQKRVIFDVGQQVSNLSDQTLQLGIKLTELLLVNDYEMGVLSKRLKKSESEIIKSVPACVITLGKNGSKIYLQGEEIGKVSAVMVQDVVDPTGAGDGFRAGFLYGYMRNWDLKKCCELGSTIASFVIEHHGTQEHVMSKTDIQNRYKKMYKNVIVL